MIPHSNYAAIRYGYGFSPLEGSAADAAGLLAGLVGPDRMAAVFPVPGYDVIVPTLAAYDAAARARRADRDNKALTKDLQHQVRTIQATLVDGFRARLSRAAYAPDGFRERLVQFWADHFTVRAKTRRDRALPTAYVEAAIRPNISARFGDLLVAAVTHPMMLGYLDQNRSTGPGSAVGIVRGRGLNENLAREVLELHTLGVGGGYGQDDVRSFAELLTGLTFQSANEPLFRAVLAEPGAETVLGEVYGADGRAVLGDITAALHDLALHPDTARHLARKLAVHFVADDPDAGLVNHMAGAYRSTGGDLTAVYAALLDHPAAWAGFGAKARQPYDFLVAAVRVLGVPPQRLAALSARDIGALFLDPLTVMAQPWQEPRGPDGWEEATAAWISPQGLAGRIQWAMSAPATLTPALPDPRFFVQTALGAVAGPKLIWAATQAATVPDGIGIVLASPEFNRR